MDELQFAIKAMEKKKSVDKDNVVLEMFWYGSADVHNSLLHMLNDVLRTGIPHTNWYETHFSILHKGGSTEDANNWRPIAILSIIYKKSIDKFILLYILQKWED